MKLELGPHEAAGYTVPERLVRVAAHFYELTSTVPQRISMPVHTWQACLRYACNSVTNPMFTVRIADDRKATILAVMFGQAVELVADQDLKDSDLYNYLVYEVS